MTVHVCTHPTEGEGDGAIVIIIDTPTHTQEAQFVDEPTAGQSELGTRVQRGSQEWSPGAEASIAPVPVEVELLRVGINVGKEI